MEPETKSDSKIDGKEKLAGALHKTQGLPHLRTYQGDVASFIRDKDQSVVSIAIKEKERQEKVEKEQVASSPKPSIKLPVNLMAIVLGIFLLTGSAVVALYTFYLKNDTGRVDLNLSTSIIRADESITLDLSSINQVILGETVNSVKSGMEVKKIVEIKITDAALKKNSEARALVDKLKFDIPEPLKRSLLPESMVGVYGENASSSSFFVIFKEKDYGIAFRDMLEWEDSLYSDMKPFLNQQLEIISTFKDSIISNKDTRILEDSSGEIVILYTFLDKNTILITESENSLKQIADYYATRNFVR